MATLRCGDCQSPLEVAYPDGGKTLPPASAGGYTPPLPFHKTESYSLLPSETPLAELPKLAAVLRLRSLSAKLEYLSPTGSFKDRGTAVMIGVATESGVSELVEDSSGNAGASVAAYAARNGIRAHIFAPASAPRAKLQQIEVYGAEVHVVEGSREETAAAAVDFSRERGLVYASHALSPFFVEGTKTFAYEIARQSGNELPDHIVFPVGNGSLLLGAWKGLRELRESGEAQQTPRLHCVQSTVRPVVADFMGEEWSAGGAGTTVAGGIAVAAPVRLEQIVQAVRATGGTAVSVDDAEIVRWQWLLAGREGIFAEPTSAAAFAGLFRLVADGTIDADDAVLVPVTGAGTKDRLPEPADEA